MLVQVFAATLLSLALSCQNIRLMAEDGSVVVGRSLEFSEVTVPASNSIVTEPAGKQYVMPRTENCDDPFAFTSEFDILRFKVMFDNEFANSTLGGINSEGMVASTLYFTGYAEFKDPASFKGKKCDKIVPQTKLSTYVLAKYSTVKQLKKDLKNKVFPKVWTQGDLGLESVPFHYVFHDVTGQSLVLEYTKNGMKYFDNTIGAMTNSPDFEWHMTNLMNYPTMQRTEFDGYKYHHKGQKQELKPKWVGTGFSGIPGDYSSPSRFVKAATMASHSGKAEDATQAVTRMIHMMNAADIPKGILKAEGGLLKEEVVDYTWWISVYDLSRKCVYYRGYDDLSVKRVCLDVPFFPTSPSCIDVEGGGHGFVDKTRELKDMGDKEEYVTGSSASPTSVKHTFSTPSSSFSV